MSTDITETIDGLVLRREQLKAEIAERELEIYSINLKLEGMVEGMSGKVSVNGVNLRVRELLPTTKCDSDRLKSEHRDLALHVTKLRNSDVPKFLSEVYGDQFDSLVSQAKEQNPDLYLEYANASVTDLKKKCSKNTIAELESEGIIYQSYDRKGELVELVT